MSDACRLAGVSTAPYKRWGKSEMIKVMVMEGMMRHKGHMLAALEPYEPGSPERVMALGREYVRFASKTGLRPNWGRPTAMNSQAMGESLALCCAKSRTVLAKTRSPKTCAASFILWNFVHGCRSSW